MKNVAIVSSKDLFAPGESLAAEDWVGRRPGESLADFRARRDAAAEMTRIEQELPKLQRRVAVMKRRLGVLRRQVEAAEAIQGTENLMGGQNG